MKIMFQVAQEHNLEHISYGAMKFYEKYFGELYKRFTNPELAQKILPLIANSFYERNIDHIDYAILHDDLQLSASEPISEELFRLNILEKQGNAHKTYVRFYFNNLRDFLIAFSHLKLDLMLDHELDAYIREMKPFGVHLDVLILYYQLASDSHKRVLDRDAPLNALKYVRIYEDILEGHFLNFKSSFDPYTSGKIGFVGFLDFSSKSIYEHGFRAIQNDKEEVLLLPWNDELDFSRSAFINGVSTLKWSTVSWEFKDIDVKAEAMWGEIEPALKDIVGKGLLNESQNQYLLLERVLATCLTYLSDELAIDPHEPTVFSLPLDLDRVLYQLLFNRARRIIAFARNLPETDAIAKEARQLAEQGVFLDDGAPYQPGDYEDYIEWRLLEAIRALHAMGISRLENDVLLNWYGQGINPQWDNKKVPDGALMEKFYSLFLEQYRQILEVNFPSFCRHFELYNEFPLKAFLYTKLFNGTLCIRVVHCSEKPICENVVVFCKEEDLRFDYESRTVVYKGEQITLRCIHTEPLFKFLGPFNLTPHCLPYKAPSGVMPISMLVYEQLKKELPEAFKKIAADLGAPVRRLGLFSAQV